MVGYAKKGTMNSFRAPALFVCILHAVIGDVSVLSLLSVLRITNLRVCNTYAGSTPVASTAFIFNQLRKICTEDIRSNAGKGNFWGVGSFWRPRMGLS